MSRSIRSSSAANSVRVCARVRQESTVSTTLLTMLPDRVRPRVVEIIAIISLHVLRRDGIAALTTGSRVVRVKTSWPRYRGDVATAGFLFHLLLQERPLYSPGRGLQSDIVLRRGFGRTPGI